MVWTRPNLKRRAAMLDYITPDQFIEGIVWTIFAVCGLFFLFLLVALVMLAFWRPTMPKNVRRAQP
jgi:hypothetical protein